MNREIFPRELLPKEVKLLERLKLTDSQRSKVTEVWQNSKPEKFRLYNFVAWIFSPIMIAGLLVILLYPQYANVGNLIKVLIWSLDGFGLVVMIFVMLGLLIVDVGYKSIKNDSKQKADKIQQAEDNYYKSVLSQPILLLWAGKSRLPRIYGYIMAPVMFVLLALNGYTITSVFVIFCTLAGLIFRFLMKERTQLALDQLAKEITAVDQTGKVINGEIIEL